MTLVPACAARSAASFGLPAACFVMSFIVCPPLRGVLVLVFFWRGPFRGFLGFPIARQRSKRIDVPTQQVLVAALENHSRSVMRPALRIGAAHDVRQHARARRAAADRVVP